MGTMKTTHASIPPLPSFLDVRHLRLVHAVAREQSVTRAAGLLHLSQSAVSHQLVDLERALETRLFDRVGKKMVPTLAGERVLAAAERILADLCALERQIQDLAIDVRTPLRVTSSCFTSYNWLPAALTNFGAKHPRVDLVVVIEATRRAVDALLADEVDVAIVTDPPRDESWAVAEVVASEIVAVASPRHVVAARAKKRRGVLKWGDLRGAELLVYDIMENDLARLMSAIRESWRNESGERLAQPAFLRKIPLAEALLELARAGSGVGVVDRWTVEGLLKRSRLVVLPLVPKAPRTFYAVWRKANPRKLPLHDLLGVIRPAARARCDR